MAKFYVASGDLEMVIMAENHKEAAIKALKSALNKREENDEDPLDLGLITGISQSTFNPMRYKGDDVYIATEQVIGEAEVEDYYPCLKEIAETIEESKKLPKSRKKKNGK